MQCRVLSKKNKAIRRKYEASEVLQTAAAVSDCSLDIETKRHAIAHACTDVSKQHNAQTLTNAIIYVSVVCQKGPSSQSCTLQFQYAVASDAKGWIHGLSLPVRPSSSTPEKALKGESTSRRGERCPNRKQKTARFFFLHMDGWWCPAVAATATCSLYRKRNR